MWLRLFDFFKDYVLNAFSLEDTIEYRMNKRSLNEQKYIYQYHLPNRIVKLVKQAHKHESFDVDPPISVSGEMRQKLMYPLTQSQILTICNTQHEVEESYFKYEMLSHLYYKTSLSVTVGITIHYKDTKNGLDIHFDRVPLRIVEDYNKKRMCSEIISVTYK
jgi:hypothetical protein